LKPGGNRRGEWGEKGGRGDLKSFLLTPEKPGRGVFKRGSKIRNSSRGLRKL